MNMQEPTGEYLRVDWCDSIEVSKDEANQNRDSLVLCRSAPVAFWQLQTLLRRSTEDQTRIFCEKELGKLVTQYDCDFMIFNWGTGSSGRIKLECLRFRNITDLSRFKATLRGHG